MTPPPTVRTVLGDREAHLLGRVNYHEHLFHRSPLLIGEDLDDEELSGHEFGLLRASGFDSMVDATPIGLGRKAEALARIAGESGATIIASTGRHRDAHYGTATENSADVLSRRFIRELTVGIARDDSEYAATESPPIALSPEGSAVRAGLIKIGIGYWSISAPERQAIDAAAYAHQATGAPIMVHTERCSAALEVLALFAELGVNVSRVVIAHADRTPDPYLHATIAETGAYLGYDGAGRLKEWPDSILITALEKLVSLGHGAQILLGADVARRSRFVSYGGMPGMGYLGNTFVPRVVQTIGDEAMALILVANPARYLAWSPAL